jgi:hypothetical protein
VREIARKGFLKARNDSLPIPPRVALIEEGFDEFMFVGSLPGASPNPNF